MTATLRNGQVLCFGIVPVPVRVLGQHGPAMLWLAHVERVLKEE